MWPVGDWGKPGPPKFPFLAQAIWAARRCPSVGDRNPQKTCKPTPTCSTPTRPKFDRQRPAVADTCPTLPNPAQTSTKTWGGAERARARRARARRAWADGRRAWASGRTGGRKRAGGRPAARAARALASGSSGRFLRSCLCFRIDDSRALSVEPLAPAPTVSAIASALCARVLLDRHFHTTKTMHVVQMPDGCSTTA